MKKNRTSTSGLFRLRVLLAFALCSSGVLLAISSFTGMGWHLVGRPEGSKSEKERGEVDRLGRYMPVPGGEADDLNGMEVDWHNRLTYPTGRFDPAWVREAAAQDARIARSIPFGLQTNHAEQGNARVYARPKQLHRARPQATAHDRLLGLL